MEVSVFAQQIPLSLACINFEETRTFPSRCRLGCCRVPLFSLQLIFINLQPKAIVYSHLQARQHVRIFQEDLFQKFSRPSGIMYEQIFQGPSDVAKIERMNAAAEASLILVTFIGGPGRKILFTILRLSDNLSRGQIFEQQLTFLSIEIMPENERSIRSCMMMVKRKCWSTTSCI